MKAAAVLVTKESSLPTQPLMFLAVWNRKLRGWSIPGGKLEAGETAGDAARRELLEETGLEAHGLRWVYAAPASGTVLTTAIFAACLTPSSQEVCSRDALRHEPGCPHTWMSARELVLTSPYGGFYVSMFQEAGEGIEKLFRFCWYSACVERSVAPSRFCARHQREE